MCTNFCRPTTAIIAFVVVLGMSWFSDADSGYAKSIRQKIKNNTGIVVNDLRIRSASSIQKARIRRDDDGDGRLEDNETIENASQLSAPGYGARWNTGDMRNVGVGDEVFIEIQGGNIQSTSEWTIDNEPAGRVTKVGKSSDLSFNPSNSEVFVTFGNDDEFAVAYSNIQIVANNDIGNFDDLNRIFEPSGNQLFDVSYPVILEPGETFEFSLGSDLDSLVDPSRYILTFADAAPLYNPQDLFSMATAQMVPIPEPTALLLALLGLASVPLRMRHR